MMETITRAIERWILSGSDRTADFDNVDIKYKDDTNKIYTIYFPSNEGLIKLKILTFGDELKLIELK